MSLSGVNITDSGSNEATIATIAIDVNGATEHIQAFVHVDPSNGQPNAATSALQTSLISKVGDITDAAYAGTGSSSVIAALKGIYARLGASTSTVSVSNFPTTQAVSGTVTVDQSETIAALGSVADSGYSGSGSSSIIAALKGIYAKLASSISVAVSNFPTTQQVTGTVIVDQSLTVSALGSVSDSAYSGTGSGSLISLMKALINGIQGTLSSNSTVVDDSFLTRITQKALSKLTYTSNGLRVDIQTGTISSVNSANQVAMGNVNTSGQSIQQSQLLYANSFRRNLIIS